MQINLTGHHIDITDGLRQFTTTKLENLTRHFSRIIGIDVTFEIEKLEQVVKATVHVPGKIIHADAKSMDMYSAIDALVDKLAPQLQKHKDKLTDH